jgi:hypothetical protein
MLIEKQTLRIWIEDIGNEIKITKYETNVKETRRLRKLS